MKPRIRFACSCVLLITFLALPVQGQLLITEFMASNSSTLADEDNTYPDWVEIYNSSGTNVNLGGWYLTDNSANLIKWQFPATNMPPHTFMVVFASGKNRRIPGRPLHTSFSLDANGEYLGLVMPDGITRASEFLPKFPAQFADVSYGYIMTGTTTTLVPSGAAARALVPSADIGTAWQGTNYDDSVWLSGTTAIGYDLFATNYGPVIGLDVGAAMSNVNASAFMRVPFNVTDPAQFKALTLRMRYDDGFVAYLNGTEILRRNAPASPVWNSSATTSHGPPVAGSLVEDFEGAASNYTLNQYGAAPAPSVQPAGTGSTGKYLRLMTDNVGNAFNSVTFRQTAPGLFQSIVTDFDFRMTNGAGNPADGFAFMLIPTKTYGTNGAGINIANVGIEEPNFAGVFAIGVDVYPHSTQNDVSAHWNAAERINVTMPRATFELVAAVFHHMKVTLQHVTGGARVTVTLTANINGTPGAPYTPINNFFIPGLDPYDCRVQFAGRTGGAFHGLDLDNINVQFIPSSGLVAFEDFDITSSLNLLTPGANLLAVQGLNISTNDTDFLIEPQITGADFMVSTQANYISPATPGTWNNVAGAGTTAPVTFSPAPGVYSANSLDVLLASSSSSAQIRYTLDGTKPTSGSLLYTGAITLTTNAAVHARAFEAGKVDSELTAANYVLLDFSLTNFTSNLPLIIVDTLGGTIVPDLKIPAYAVFINTNASGRSSFNGPFDFRGRVGIEDHGQSSLQFPKKSLNLETDDEGDNDKKVSLLGLPKGSDWDLYAPYTDKAFLNDFLAYELHEAMGHYAVRRRFVEVFVRSTAGRLSTNDYQGIYVLLEKIRVDADRVDIAKLGDNDNTEPNVTGGYIWKKDKDSPGDVNFTTSSGQLLKYHDPKGSKLTAPQQAWLSNYLNQFEATLYGANWRDPLYGYVQYADVDSFVDEHWIVEFPKNIDGIRLSDYMSKDRGGKIRFEPIWDWNLSFGNANYLEGGYTNGWYYPQLSATDDIWFKQLRTDPDFYQKIIDRWGQLRTNIFALSNLLARVDRITNQLNEAQARDFAKWPRLGTYVWPNPDGNTNGTWIVGRTWDVDFTHPTNYAGIIQQTKKWITGRSLWVDSQFLRAPVLSLPAGPISPGTTMTITGTVGSIYYTLDGTDPRAPGGAISSSARLYAGSISLTNNAGVFARTFFTNAWSPPARSVYVVAPPALAITEIMYHPADPPPGSPYTEEDFEYIELKNTGTNSINLSGARLAGGIDYTFRPSVLMPTGLPTANDFDNVGTGFFATNLNNAPLPGTTSGGPSGNFLRLLSGGATNLLRNRVTFAQTASGPYGRVTADFDFRAATIAAPVSSAPPTLQDFEGGGGAAYALSGSAVLTAGDAASTGSFIRLVPAVNSLSGGVGFERTATGPWNTVIATFDYRITPGTGQADGMSFALLNTANFGINGVAPAMSEEPNLANSLGIGIDVYANAGEVNNNHVSLHWNGAIVGSVATPNFDMSNGRFHRAQVIVRFSGGKALVTVRMTADINGTPGTPVTLFQDVALNNVNPYEMRAGFGARTGGENAAHDIDNINVQYTTETATSAGLSMLLLPTNLFGTNGAGTTLAHFTDVPACTNSFALDLAFHPSNYVNDATLYYNGAQAARTSVSTSALDLDSGVFHHAHVVIDTYLGGTYASVTLTPDIFGTPGTPIVVVTNLFITGLLPGDARVEFAGRNGTIDTALDLENVLVSYDAFASLLLAPGESILVVRNRAAFESRYGTGFRIAGEYFGQLDNSGDHIVLLGPVGETILDFTYDDHWYRLSDGLGFSLVNRDANTPPANYNSADTWRGSTYQGGSPDATDPVLNIPPVVVNEILANSVLPDVDLIELHNPTTNTADVGGWYLTDDFFTPKKFRIPNGTLLAPGGFIVFSETNFNAVPGATNSFALSASGEEIWLFSADVSSNLTGYAQGYDFGPSEEGVSFGRFIDNVGDDHFVAQITNTFGATNAGPRLSPVVISEIMYHPADVAGADNELDEFIEIENTSSAGTPLYSSSLPTDTWHLRSAVDFDFPLNVTLAAGERALIVSFDPTNSILLAAFRAKYGITSAVQVFGPWSGKLDNSADDLELRRPLPPGTNGTDYALADKVDYYDSLPWNPVADGYGASLQRLNSTAYGSDPSNWKAAIPTPGAAPITDTPPQIVGQPQHATVAVGGSTSFSLNVLGAALRYQWRAFGTNIPDATNAMLSLSNIQVSQAGDYHVGVFNRGGAVLSATAHLTVLGPVFFTTSPTNQNVLPGTNVTMVAFAVGNGPVRYQWRFEGADILNATNASYSFTNANLNEHHGNFSVVAIDDISTTLSSNAFIYVLVKPGIVTHIQPTAVLQGANATFSLVATGAPPLWYRWIRGGASYATTSVPVLVISNIQASTLVRVAVTNVAAPNGVFSPGPTAGQNVTLTMLPDFDHDGIADAWEVQYGFNTNNAADAALDFDGDGMSNRDEYLAGTNPTDALSVLKLVQSATNANTLTFVAQTNLSYSVLWRTNFSSALWNTLTSITAQTGVRTIQVDTAAGPPWRERYYRIVTPLVP